jgi:hypothetical protein
MQLASSVEVAAAVWQEDIKVVMEKHIPRAKITSRPEKNWITPELVSLHRNKAKGIREVQNTQFFGAKDRISPLKTKGKKGNIRS